MDSTNSSVITKLKDLVKYIYFKYHRIKYFLAYGIPISNRKMRNDEVKSVFDCIGPIESAAIIGKGASIYESSPRELVQSCDFKCILNSVDIEYLEPYLGNKIDAQMTTHVGSANSLMPVLSKELIEKYGVGLLICNSVKTYEGGVPVENYWQYFSSRVAHISCMPEDVELQFDADPARYGGRGLTIAANLLRILYDISSLKKIVFAGIDAFHFPYAYRQDVDEQSKVYYSINSASEDPKNTHGLPFLRFLFDTLKTINQTRKLEVYFPAALKAHIEFPNASYVKFYN